MYLSRLLLNPQHRQVQRELADRYQLHRTLMRAFPETLPPDERVLHRVEVNPHSGQIAILVQSQSHPDWSPLTDKPHYLVMTPAVKSLNLALNEGQELHFRLRANPTIKTRSNRHPQKKTRVPLVHEEKQMAWLVRKGEQNGFEIIQQCVSYPETYHSRKNGGNPIQLFTIRFDGVLRLSDAEAFATAIAMGIGPAKAFGCGLLSIAPSR